MGIEAETWTSPVSFSSKFVEKISQIFWNIVFFWAGVFQIVAPNWKRLSNLQLSERLPSAAQFREHVLTITAVWYRGFQRVPQLCPQLRAPPIGGKTEAEFPLRTNQSQTDCSFRQHSPERVIPLSRKGFWLSLPLDPSIPCRRDVCRVLRGPSGAPWCREVAAEVPQGGAQVAVVGFAGMKYSSLWSRRIGATNSLRIRSISPNSDSHFSLFRLNSKQNSVCC